MKVILCFVLVAVASSAASPMFGASGMMKRRFPGAPDMTVQTYREITNNNAGRAGNAADATPAVSPAVARVGPGEQDNLDQSWMFSNAGPAQFAVQPARRPFGRPAVRPAVRPALRPAAAPVSSLPAYQNSVDDTLYYHDYPTSFYPRESYAYLDFPDQASFDDYFGGVYGDHPKPIIMPKRHYY